MRKLRLRAMGGPLVLVLWQAAPVAMTQDSVGRIRLTLGYGQGLYQQTRLSCEGNVVGADSYDYEAGGAQLDVWPIDQLRLTAYGGHRAITATEDPLAVGPSRVEGRLGYARTKGLQVAIEDRRLGIGFGRSFDDSRFETATNFYVRAGNIDGVHGRFDINRPQLLWGSTGKSQFGIERNTGHLRATSWYFGMAFCHFCGDSVGWHMFGDVSLPIADGADVMAQGMYGTVDRFASWSFGLGARLAF